jgi:drug/metabolite transporter (DMT)-like permease
VFSVLALASALVYGAADFLGGFTSRRSNTVAITVVSQLAGLLLLTVTLPLLPQASPDLRDHVWGGLAGLTGGGGVALLYYALSVGTMAIVAPITAVCAAMIPVMLAIALGERPGIGTIAGIALAIIAIWLVSRSNGSSLSRRSRDAKADSARSARLALMAGVAIGLFFFCLARPDREAGLWPLLAARLVSVPLFGLIALIGGWPLRMPAAVGATAVAGGALDMLANLLYLVATWYGPLAIVATLASLYPASTVLLARFTLGERLTRAQSVGVLCAIVAVVVIVGSTS